VINKSLKFLPYLVITFFSLFNLKFVFQEYAWADDWSFYGEYHSIDPVNSIEHLIGYRPLLQLIYNTTWPLLGSIYDLRIFRIISVTGTLLLAILAFNYLKKIGFTVLLSLAFAVGILFLPTFQIYQKWATAFPYSWCAVLSISSWAAIRNKRFKLSLFLLVITFLIYQPVGTFGLFFAFAETIKSRRLERHIKIYAAITLIAFILATVLSKLIMFSYGIEPKARAGIISTLQDAVDKIIWISSRPIILLARPFAWDSPTSLEAIGSLSILLVCVFALWLNFRSFTSLVKLITLLTLFYILMLLPFLPIKENQIEFRTLPATSAAGLFMVLFGIESLFLRKFISTKALTSILMSFMLAVALYSNAVTQTIFVKPYQVSKEFIFEKSKAKPREVLYYQITYGDWPNRDFIGSPSAIYDLQMSWVVVPMLEALVGDKFSKIQPVGDKVTIKGNFLNLDELKSIPLN
jgi:hypothetical protein